MQQIECSHPPPCVHEDPLSMSSWQDVVRVLLPQLCLGQSEGCIVALTYMSIRPFLLDIGEFERGNFSILGAHAEPYNFSLFHIKFGRPGRVSYRIIRWGVGKMMCMEPCP